MRKLGIIGGMSWSSTALYYEHINRGISQRLGGLHCAELAIESVDFAGIAAMQAAGDWDGIAKILMDASSHLQASGAEAVVIACNTVHKCYDAVAANIEVPVFHIGDSTADRLVADKRKHVALLGTRFTMLEPHIRGRLEARGITLAPIDEVWVREVDRIIFDELAAGRVVRDSQRKLKTLITSLRSKRSRRSFSVAPSWLWPWTFVPMCFPSTTRRRSMRGPVLTGCLPKRNPLALRPDLSRWRLLALISAR